MTRRRWVIAGSCRNTQCHVITALSKRTTAMPLRSIEIPARSNRIAPVRADRPCILTINGGSSSLKFALFAMADGPVRLLSGRIERIGMPGSRLVLADTKRGQVEDSEVEAPDQAAAVGWLIRRLGDLVGLKNIAVAGHRVVHGGNRLYRPELITPEILDELRRITPYDPDHLPGEIGAIEAFRRLNPELPRWRASTPASIMTCLASRRSSRSLGGMRRPESAAMASMASPTPI